MAAEVHRRSSKLTSISFLFAALVAVAALMSGNLINIPSSAAQTTPVFWWDGNRWDYFSFINQMRANVNAYNNAVPNSQGHTVDHTDPNAINRFFEAVIGIGDRNNPSNARQHQLRIRIRASDLYVVGWYTGSGTYNYLGSAWEAGLPATGRTWQLSNSGNYVDLERMANSGNLPGAAFNRSALRYDQARVNAFGWDLWNADNPARMAAAVVYFAQFISEATRFRGISDVIGWNGFGHRSQDNWQFSTVIDNHLVGQENQWAHLSQRFNWMLANNVAQDNPRNALQAWYRDSGGIVRLATLLTMADYAKVMNTVRGFPGRP